MAENSHISEPLKWGEAVFVGYKVLDGLLYIFFENGEHRKMKMSWGKDAWITLEKIQNLRVSQKIEYATWSSYSEDEWFCDVRPRILT